jgi:hypothetical protein
VPRRSRLAVAPLLLLPLLAGACGDDGGGGAAPTTVDGGSTTTQAPGAPPISFEGLQAIYQPAVEPLGLDLTRAAVNDFESGLHLALYVVPRDDTSGPEGYLDRVLPLLAALQPHLFEQFPALVSFDICQEPVQAGGREDEFPPPVTLVLLEREAFESVPDWSTATLADLAAAVRVLPTGQFDVIPQIERLDAYAEYDDAAGGG